MEDEGYDSRVAYHRARALGSYLLILVVKSIFVDKSEIHVDFIYLRYFIDLESIHEYNLEVSYLVYLYSKLVEVSTWNTQPLNGNISLFMVIILHLY